MCDAENGSSADRGSGLGSVRGAVVCSGPFIRTRAQLLATGETEFTEESVRKRLVL